MRVISAAGNRKRERGQLFFFTLHQGDDEVGGGGSRGRGGTEFIGVSIGTNICYGCGNKDVQILLFSFVP